MSDNGIETITIRTADREVTTTPGVLKQALKVVQGAAARSRASSQPQRDLEEATGVAEDQKRREAEAAGIAVERLRSIIERVERLEEERKALGGDIKDIFAEAKSAGFDVKVIRQVIRIRRQEPAEVEEQETLLSIYRKAMGC